MPDLGAAPIPQPRKLWSLVTAGGLYVLASIGPSTGAVMGWIEREHRRGLAILKEGWRIRPVTLAYDATRDEERAQDNIRTMRRGGR